MNKIIGLYLHYLNSMKRNPARIIEIIVWPFMEVILFSMLASSETHNTSTSTLTLSLLAGVVYWNFTARTIQETIAQITDDFLTKNIQSLFVSPITPFHIVTGLLLSSLTKMAISLFFLCIGVALFFPSFFLSIRSPTLLWVIQLELFGVALSLVGVAFIFSFGARVSFIGWMISTAIQVLSCVYYTRESLPFGLYHLSFLIPSSYVFEQIRNFYVKSPIAWSTSFITWALSLLYVALGGALISIGIRIGKKFGVLTRS